MRTMSRTVAFMTIDEISDNFSLLDEWEDRYRYIIELGRTLAPLPAEAHIDANKVQGCASQVWLTTAVQPNGSRGPILTFRGDSDAHIVRGLIAILFALYSDKAARDILAIDPSALFERLDLREHLTAGHGAKEESLEPAQPTGTMVLIGFARGGGPIRLMSRSGERPFTAIAPEEESSWCMYRIRLPYTDLDILEQPTPEIARSDTPLKGKP
jgi:cysteine desulfuration protein SufE